MQVPIVGVHHQDHDIDCHSSCLLVALRTGTPPLFFVPSLGRFTSAADDLYINADIFTLSFFFDRSAALLFNFQQGEQQDPTHVHEKLSLSIIGPEFWFQIQRQIGPWKVGSPKFSYEKSPMLS